MTLKFANQWRLRNLDRNRGLSSTKFMAAKVATNFHSDLTTLLQRHAWRRAFKNFDWNGKNVLVISLVHNLDLLAYNNFHLRKIFSLLLTSWSLHIGRSIKRFCWLDFIAKWSFAFVRYSNLRVFRLVILYCCSTFLRWSIDKRLFKS